MILCLFAANCGVEKEGRGRGWIDWLRQAKKILEILRRSTQKHVVDVRAQKSCSRRGWYLLHSLIQVISSSHQQPASAEETTLTNPSISHLSLQHPRRRQTDRQTTTGGIPPAHTPREPLTHLATISGSVSYRAASNSFLALSLMRSFLRER